MLILKKLVATIQLILFVSSAIGILRNTPAHFRTWTPATFVRGLSVAVLGHSIQLYSALYLLRNGDWINWGLLVVVVAVIARLDKALLALYPPTPKKQ